MFATAWLLFFVVGAYAQSRSDPKSKQSPTYPETVAKLKDWSRHCCVEDDDQRFAWLFAEGDLKRNDLLEACGEPDPDVHGRALQLLQVLGDPQIEACAARMRRSDGENRPLLLGRASALTENDFTHFESVLGSRSCEMAKACSEEQLPEISDSFVYSLILDGSDRAQVLIRRVYALRSLGAEVRFAPETESEAISLIPIARKAGEELGIVLTRDSMCATAFYISPKYRTDALVTFLARSPDGNRMLIRVSYNCGLLCGKGYEVVLQRSGSGWKYAFIAMEWIS